MKGGCFGELSERYGVEALSLNSHLFISGMDVPNFPGRRFIVQTVTTMNRKSLAKALNGTDHANITVRNFPMSVAELRKRLKIKDGGDLYIFGTTLGQHDHILIFCRKA